MATVRVPGESGRRSDVLIAAVASVCALVATPRTCFGQEPKSFALVRYSESPCQGPDCVPLVLIHGIHGYDDCRESITSGSADCNWMPLVNYLKETPQVWSRVQIYFYRYISDNGKTTIDIGAGLRSEIESTQFRSEFQKSFVVVAHSMGGIVARTFLNHGSPRGYDRVLGVITLASPHHGTPTANKHWRNWKVEQLTGSTERLCNPLLACLACRLTPVCLVEASDSFYWKRSDLAENPLIPNRSDLLWDDYDGYFSGARQALPNWEREDNPVLRGLPAADAKKLIVYGSYLDPNDRSRLSWTESALLRLFDDVRIPFDHKGLEALSSIMERYLGMPLNDGLVSILSALFNRNQYVAGRRWSSFVGYDHLDMLGNPDGDSRKDFNGVLFISVAQDIAAILSFQGVPPRLVDLALQSSPAVSGSTARLVYSVRNTDDNIKRVVLKAWITGPDGRLVESETVADLASGEKVQSLPRDLSIPAGLTSSKVTIRGEVLPVTKLKLYAPSADPAYTTLKVIQADVMTAPRGTPPTISLSLATPAKLDYQVGDTIQLSMKTTAGQGDWRVTPFLWVDGPNGRLYLYDDGQGGLRETAAVTPVSRQSPAIDYENRLPAIIVSRGPVPPSGPYTWRAALYSSEVVSPANLIAQSNAVTYRVVALAPTQPVVTRISSPLSLYRAGDTMTIFYSTLRGTTAGTYDLLVRITSQASGNQYYFYDDNSDSNRWIHQTNRPLLTGPPVDGNFQIPSGIQPPIVIDRDTPSGQYTLHAYFSVPGRNTPIGISPPWLFTLQTPTAEGGCFIATAAFGSPMAPSVERLRAFRDRFLLPYGWGRSVAGAYYRIAPPIASAIQPHAALRKAVRVILWPAVVFAAIALQLNLWLSLLALAALTAAVVFIVRRAPARVRIALLLLALGAAAHAADVQGNAVRSTPFPLPIPGVRVELEQTGTTALSSADGVFNFRGLAVGQYSLKASAPGFFTATVRFSVASASSVVKVVVALTPISTRLYEYYLAHTAETDGWWTFFSLLNPNYTAADVTMAAYDAAGTYLGSSSKISRLNINNQVFGKPSDFFAADVAAKAAWYKFTASAPLTGFEMFGNTTGVLAGFPLPTADANQLYIPHIAQDASWWTGLSLLSVGVQSNRVRLEARDGQGTLLADAAGLNLMRPGEKTVAVIDSYFGWDFPLDIQWALVTSDGPITGFELFGTQDFKMLAAVPGLSRGAKRFFLPHIETTEGWWTGIAMLNVDSRPGVVRLTAYGENGASLAVSRAINLRAWERSVDAVESYFDNWPSATKYLEASSDVDVVAFELVGRFTPPLFGGLPAVSATGPQIAYSYAISTAEWETSLGIVNTSAAAAQVTLQAMDPEGRKLAEIRLTLPARGYRLATLKSLFRTVPSGTTWVQAFTSTAPLAGFLRLARVANGQFTDIPAEPIVAANMIGQQTVAGLAALVPQDLAGLAAQVELEPVSGSGLRVRWSAAVDPTIQTLAGGQVHSGDILLAVEGMPVLSRADLWTAYQRWGSRSKVSVQLLRPGVGIRIVQFRNPVQAKGQAGK